MKDRDWKRTANPQAWQYETRLEDADNKMLEKRKKQKLL